MPQIPSDIAAPIRLPRGQTEKPVGSPVSLVFPWWERPTNQSLDFQTPQVPAVLAAVAGTRLLITTYVVNPGYHWVLRGVNLFVDAPTPLFNVIWLVRFREAQLFDPLRFAGRNLANLEIPYSFAKRGAGPGTLDILAINQAATGPWTIAASVSGWVTPDTEVGLTYPINLPALG
jgi:hypothetical protein